jgi:hypothetical protein
MDEAGYIKLSREVFASNMWTRSPAIFKVAAFLMLKANFRDGLYRGIRIPRGSLVKSSGDIGAECGLSRKAVRHALDVLEADEFLERSYPFGAKQVAMITICNYNKFQGMPASGGAKDGAKQGAKQGATIEEGKKGTSTEESTQARRSARFSPPSVDQVDAYCQERSNGINAEQFVSFYESRGWMIGKNKMKDWKAAVRTWEQRRKDQRKSEPFRVSDRTEREKLVAQDADKRTGF